MRTFTLLWITRCYGLHVAMGYTLLWVTRCYGLQSLTCHNNACIFTESAMRIQSNHENSSTLCTDNSNVICIYIEKIHCSYRAAYFIIYISGRYQQENWFRIMTGKMYKVASCKTQIPRSNQNSLFRLLVYYTIAISYLVRSALQ